MPLREMRTDLPAKLTEIVKKMLAFEPTNRVTLDELLKVLDELDKDEGNSNG